MGHDHDPPSPTLDQQGVHTSPRRPRTTFAIIDDSPPRARPRRKAAAAADFDADQEEAPYPRWFTILVRTGLVGVDIGVLVFTVRFLHAWRGTPKFDDERYSLAVAAAAVALFIDGLAVVMSLVRRYGEWKVWTLAVLGDLCVGVMGILAFVMVTWVDHNGGSYEQLGWWWEPEGLVVGTLALVVGIPHFVGSVGGCVGCCLLSCRDRRKAQIPSV